MDIDKLRSNDLSSFNGVLSENDVPYSPLPEVEMVDAQTELYEVNTKVGRPCSISFQGRAGKR
jgi:hypothetical protein